MITINHHSHIDLIRAILSLEEIASVWNPDDSPFDPFSVDENEGRLLCTIDADHVPVGVMAFDLLSHKVVKIHPYLIRECRPMFRQLWTALVSYVEEYLPDTEVLSASIGTCHPRVIGVCRYFGFKDSYIEFNKGVKFGRSYDLLHLTNIDWRIK